MLRELRIVVFLMFSLGSSIVWAEEANTDQYVSSKAELGEKLFFDVNLSRNRTQSCATCHNPEHGFVDDRMTEVGRAVSLGDDDKSLGDRNTPTLAYARFIPPFHQHHNGGYAGGQFWDGRERNLVGQAGGPFLNASEMGMPDKTSVVERLQENPLYITAFKQLFGEQVFTKPETAYAALTESIAEFEKTDQFAPFDSKYDRYLRGEVELTEQESLGKSLFFDRESTSCSSCHQIMLSAGSEDETFSNYEYHNLGVPVNQAVRERNGKGKTFVDNGLLNHPQVSSGKEAGKFKVPTLRNVAVTGPYMHNGVFSDLKTVVQFYDKFNNSQRKLNPETGKPWQSPEVAKNLALEEKEFQAPALKDEEVEALVAFLETLTDQRFVSIQRHM